MSGRKLLDPTTYVYVCVCVCVCVYFPSWNQIWKGETQHNQFHHQLFCAELNWQETSGVRLPGVVRMWSWMRFRPTVESVIVHSLHNPGGARDFSFLQADCFAHPASYSVGTGPLYTRVKRPERESDNWTPYSDEAKTEWSYTSTPPYMPSWLWQGNNLQFFNFTWLWDKMYCFLCNSKLVGFVIPVLFQ